MGEHLDSRIRERWRAFNAGGIGAIVNQLDPEFVLVDRPQVVGGTVWEGREGAAKWYETVSEAWEDIRFEVDEVVEVDQDRHIAVGRFCARGKTSGLYLEDTGAFLISERDGRMLRAEGFDTRAEALTAAETPAT